MINFVYKCRYDVSDLREIVHILRQKDGCPWDSVQTHHSIRDNFLEETYEACEAIDNDDPCLLREELGDVLMQVIFHASIEEDAHRFDLDDVADSACRKLIFRHPNLFQQSEGGRSLSWDELKQQEKGYTSTSQSLNAVARSLPGLWRARKIQKRAADAGFVWPSIDGPMQKVVEEAAELQEAVIEKSNLEEELGDLLFAAVALARAADIDPEYALHRACEKFIQRFERMESLSSRPVTDLSEAEYLALWKEAKESFCSEQD